MFAANADAYAPGDSQGLRTTSGVYQVVSTSGSAAVDKPSSQQSTLIGIAGLVALIWFFGRRAK